LNSTSVLIPKEVNVRGRYKFRS